MNLIFYKFIFPILLQAKLETKALKAKRPGFTDDRYKETAYYVENGKFYSGIFLDYLKMSKKNKI